MTAAPQGGRLSAALIKQRAGAFDFEGIYTLSLRGAGKSTSHFFLQRQQ